MHISDFDYALPEDLIAQNPLAQRDASRMLQVDRATQTFCDSSFVNFPDQLTAGDVLVINNTRVFPARLRGRRLPSGGAIELLLLRELGPKRWQALARPARRLAPGSEIVFGDGRLKGRALESSPDGSRIIEFECEEPWERVIDEIGQPPLPPYIKRDAGIVDEDENRYQTFYASQRGAIAAPTAGLHFTPSIFDAIKSRGVTIAEVTLHVGYGTFEPVRVSEVSKHRVLPEWFSISAEVADTINRTKAQASRVVAVGTTTARALESASDAKGEVVAQSGLANLTVFPGYEFKTVSALLTNFHLPQSSLMLFVCAFGGRELMLSAYRHAVDRRYRFYSYGDCMFIY
jgi:S-adenosylmethionine:tRNA ribosyltransferase-isomerase